MGPSSYALSEYRSLPTGTTTNSAKVASSLETNSKRLSKTSILFAVLFFLTLTCALALIVAGAVLSDGFTHLPGAELCTSNNSSTSGHFAQMSHLFLKNNLSICLHKDCVRIAANYINNMKKEVEPCEDFYQYSCGNFGQQRTIPGHEKKTTVLTEIRNNVDRQLRHALEMQANVNDTESTHMVRTFYRSCMDEAKHDLLDTLPLMNLIYQFGGWPLMDKTKKMNSNEQKQYEWERQAGQLTLIGIGSFFRLLVHNDLTDSRKMMLMFGPPSFLLGSRKYYLNGTNSFYIQAYHSYMSDFLHLLGADRKAIADDLWSVIDLEIQLANLSTAESGRNHSVFHNPMPFEQFKQRFDMIKWEVYFNEELLTAFHPLSNQDDINVIDLDFFDSIGPLLASTKITTIANYVMWKLVSNFDIYLPRKYQQPYERLRQLILGASQEPRWQRCVSDTKAFLPWPMSALYAHNYFNHKAKKMALKMIGDLKRSMRETLLSAEWMDGHTRATALHKLRAMGHKIGFPEYLFNQTRLLLPYSQLRLRGDAYFENAVGLKKVVALEALNRLRGPSDRKQWLTPVTAADAYHYFNGNEIIFPAGILQFPVFIANGPHYVNYGSIGMGIGHEITHGYDDLGSQYDERGNLRRWWGLETMRIFNSKKQCFIVQYGSKREPFTGRPLDGHITIGENIADNGGLRVAFNAYQLSKKERLERKADEKLPGLEQYTADQMFFIAFANTWCELVKPQAIEHILVSDAHSLGSFRVNVPLQNLPAFSRAFNCPIGSAMNPPEKCRIW